MSAFAERVQVDHLDPDQVDRLETMLSFAEPLGQLDDPYGHGFDDWPYEHAPGEARPIDGPHPEALEDAPGGYW